MRTASCDWSVSPVRKRSEVREREQQVEEEEVEQVVPAPGRKGKGRDIAPLSPRTAPPTLDPPLPIQPRAAVPSTAQLFLRQFNRRIADGTPHTIVL